MGGGGEPSDDARQRTATSRQISCRRFAVVIPGDGRTGSLCPESGFDPR